MKKLKIFPKTFLYTLGLMLIIVLLSHTLIYFLMPRAYNYQQEKALETDAARLVEQIISAPAEERVNYVTSFARSGRGTGKLCDQLCRQVERKC